MDAILIDLDGVLYIGDEAVPGAVEAVAWLRREGIPHRFLTNTSSRPRAALVEKLAALGLQIPAEAIITPAVAARDWLAGEGLSRVALFVPEATAADFAGFDLLPPEAEQGAQALVLGDLGEGWDFATLNRAFRLLMTEPQPRLLALGMTRYWRTACGSIPARSSPRCARPAGPSRWCWASQRRRSSRRRSPASGRRPMRR
jgi:ribonucleotide monophosphatase NagD (HAD superfamily)